MIGNKLFVEGQKIQNPIVDKTNNLTLVNFVDEKSIYYDILCAHTDEMSTKIILEYCCGGLGANCFSVGPEKLLIVSCAKKLVIEKKDIRDWQLHSKINDKSSMI